MKLYISVITFLFLITNHLNAKDSYNSYPVINFINLNQDQQDILYGTVSALNTLNTKHDLDYINILGFNIMLNRNLSLDEIISKLGESIIYFEYKDHINYGNICYQVDNLYVQFSSNQEIFDEKFLTSVSLSKYKSMNCIKINKNIYLNKNDFRIGMSKNQYLKTLQDKKAILISERIDPPGDKNSLDATINYTLSFIDKDENRKFFVNYERICIHIEPQFEGNELTKVTLSPECA